ncbi:reverse transcriptase family protein [Humisphaera borealis]|uniref:RNA-directed DNA polymerase n=1 Tax=Humisphaera borealis TaxID=2807512 RepID=A0A7M2WVM2_9BACT|nr:reverse transcriptase family protein [Humisphaera borealis]QOV89473.1 RNA-directed DNA polymerase [Humisphaera borealis]
MLNLKTPKNLAYRLGVSLSVLRDVADRPDDWIETLLLNDPTRPNKQREVLNVKGKLKQIQTRLLRVVLLPVLNVSPYSHGGISGRNIKTNASCHLNANYLFSADISNFYPSIGHRRVYQLFSKRLNCSPDVSRLCTKLTTYDYKLALGLPTSPILADQLFHPIDARIAGACRSMGLSYSRFVDDIAISGSFDLSPESCGVSALLERIVTGNGFELQLEKSRFGRLSEDEMTITQLRVRNGRLDVREQYVLELERQLADAGELSNDRHFDGPFYTESQVRGRVQFVGWINRDRKRQLLQRFREVNWTQAMAVGRSRGLVVQKKTLIRMQKSDLDSTET